MQQILIDSLKYAKIELKHKLISIVKKENNYSLKFKNENQIKSSIILGADGLNFIVRKNILPNNSVRKANQICWRRITKYDLPNKFKNELNEAWGKSKRFGFV
ncbi:hypothetical protein [Cellulophaga sp. HaHaR_3_176]|uniref:hypothetical protein n=1 Tax=Cellulophaga sp. HaHaR_3_176 TaxID=1942464 RepID=UPI0020B150AD|nr:hypothetical protein [Cellulophaga sp. HaHaR_3_176]